MRTPARPRSIWACAAALLLAAASAVSHPLAAAEADLAQADGRTEATEESAPFLGGFLKETRIVYPLRVGDWEAQGEHLYDQPELGASVRYQHGKHGDRWIDLYFYPAGMLPPERVDTDAQRTLDELRGLVGQPGSYEEGDFDALRTFVIPRDGDDPIPARSAGMRLVRDGEARHSALVLLVHDLYYVKGRYSVDEDALTRDDTRVQLEGFMADIVRASRIASSGACWRPLPIERSASLPRDQAVATISGEDGEAIAMLVQDRVLALDPEGPAAHAMMMTGMALSRRAVPGCVGAEPENPSVPEGSREIRLEYRAPDGGRGDPGRRLRGARSAVG